jgi:signal transduction histidine kinase
MIENPRFDDLVRRHAVAIALLLLIGAAVGDLVTGADITFTLFYLVPIAIGTWYRSRRVGLAVAVGAIIAGTAALVAGKAGVLSMVWNELGASGIFYVMIQLLNRLHGRLDDERQKRSVAVAQLRHAERLNVIGTLAAGVAHELGTPLNVIAGNAQLIDRPAVNYERVHRASETILRQTRRMSTIISHLLEFGRRGGANRDLIDLRALLERAATLLEPLALRRGCAIVRPTATDKIMVWANESELEQVIANLVMNALQASSSGGSVSLDCEQIVKNGQPVAVLSVEDHGSGIAPEDLPRIFDPFFTTKQVGEGTGLGLSVTYGIVEDHGGAIHVRSERGHGTRFVVELPVTPPVTAPLRAALQPEATS